MAPASRASYEYRQKQTFVGSFSPIEYDGIQWFITGVNIFSKNLAATSRFWAPEGDMKNAPL
jgi:hypothetical protein